MKYLFKSMSAVLCLLAITISIAAQTTAYKLRVNGLSCRGVSLSAIQQFDLNGHFKREFGKPGNSAG